MIESKIETHLGDCLDILPSMPDQSVEAIITDLPYGTTACSWDEIIPFAPMWEQVKRTLKPRGVFVTTTSQPFTSRLVCSNLGWFKCEWIWNKVLGTGHLNCEKLPLKVHENIIVFSGDANGSYTYNPQKTRHGKARWKGGAAGGGSGNEVYGAYGKRKSYNNQYYPTTIIEVSNGNRTREEVGYHPTQKPVSLYEYLILTYTNEGDTVLDFCAGSGTTAIACLKTGRNCTLVEKDPGYFKIAEKRIRDAQQQMRLL